MKNKKLIFFLAFIMIDILAVAAIISPYVNTQPKAEAATETISVRPVAASILATGTVEAQNQATLHFQTSGKLVSLPFQEGDMIRAGQTIAQLDTYTLQRQLTAALNTYRSTRDQFDQTQQNANSDILQNTQRGTLNAQGAGMSTSVSDTPTTNYLNDVAKRIVDENQANLDNSVINVEIANNALQLATLSSPITGVLTHEDVTTSNVNVTPTTSFTVADPNSEVFRANISEADINFVSVGSPATITITGMESRPVSGTVSKIYPQKITLPSGDSVYQVDITSDDLPAYAKLSQTGSVVIKNAIDQSVTLLPAWTVMNNQYVWVLDSSNTPVLKKVTVGDTIEGQVEILSGLTSTDRVVTDPKLIAAKHYSFL